jgi:hypothetical protein
MNAKDLSEKFPSKVAIAGVEREVQKRLNHDFSARWLDDVEHCKNVMARDVIPLLVDLKSHLPDTQFSCSPQIDGQDHRIIGVSFTIGDGPPTTISTAFGNVIVTHAGVSGSSKGVNFVVRPMPSRTFPIPAISREKR